MNRGILCLLICLVATATAAQSLPVSELRDSPTYPTAALAAQAALQQAMKRSVVVEYGGAVVRCARGFRFTEPVTQNDTNHVNYRIEPGRCRIVGVYHTHPEGPRSHEFSPTDAETAARLNATSYLGVVQDGSLRALRPGSPPEFGVRIGYVHNADALLAREQRIEEERARVAAAPGHWRGFDVRRRAEVELSVHEWKRLMSRAARIVRFHGSIQLYDARGKVAYVVFPS